MFEPLEWCVLILTALVGGAAVGRGFVRRLRARRERARLVCPERGALVECTLLHDDRRGACVGVETCSAFPDGEPTCERACARLITLGLPLRVERPDSAGEGGAGARLATQREP